MESVMTQLVGMGMLFAAEAGAMESHFTLGAMWAAMGIIGKGTVFTLLIMSMASMYLER